MPDEMTEQEQGGPVKLEELENLSFEPDWARKDHSNRDDSDRNGGVDSKQRRYRNDGDGNVRDNFRRNGPRDGKSRFNRGRSRTKEYHRDGDGRNRRGGGFGRRDFRADRPRFDPIVDVEFYPNDANFDELVEQLRSSCKTYELFAVARLFLGKPERFAMVVKRKENDKDKNLYLTIDDGFVFNTESEAVSHVLDAHADKYFDSREEDVQPPKGDFSVLHKCGMTGRVLCPPNYHEYQKILLDHHDRYLPNVPFEKFKSSIVKTSDQAEIGAWKESVSKVVVYSPKGCNSENADLKTSSELRSFFIDHFKNKAVSQCPSVRIPGDALQDWQEPYLCQITFV